MKDDKAEAIIAHLERLEELLKVVKICLDENTKALKSLNNPDLQDACNSQKDIS